MSLPEARLRRLRRTSLAILFIVATAVLIGCGNSASSSAPLGVVNGTAHAGPTCPVVRPGDPACQDRPVAGAVIVATDGSGKEVARATTDAVGAFTISLPPGNYVLVPQPVIGLMGTAAPMNVALGAGVNPLPVDVSYDTGIR